MDSNKKACPDCAETVLEAAKVCKHCGYRFDADKIAAGPKPAPTPAFDVFHCPSCQKPTPEEAGCCKHCKADFSKPAPDPSQSATEETGWPDKEISTAGCSAILIALALLGYFLISQCSATNEAERIETEKQAAASTERRKVEDVENKRQGFHCLSGWDGSHPDVVSTIKGGLRDPDSFEHIKTIITPANAAGQHQLMMSYRAKNGFGGMMPGRVIATVNHTSCKATITASE